MSCHSVCAGLEMFSASTLSILAFSNSLISEPARYSAKCTSAVSGLRTLTECSALSMSPSWTCQMDGNAESLLLKNSREAS